MRSGSRRFRRAGCRPRRCATGRRSRRPMRPPDLEPNKRKAPGTPDPARLHAVGDRGRKS